MTPSALSATPGRRPGAHREHPDHAGKARLAAAGARALPLVLALALALTAFPAQAEKGDKEKPINYSADNGDVNYQTKIGTLAGNVIVTQGTMTIHADKIVIRQNPDNSVAVSATGNPVSFRQKRDGVDEYFEGFAQRAEYDGAKEVLELFDRALLRRGEDEIRSNYITYNAQTELFKAEGRAASPATPKEGNPGARVRGVFQPRSEAAAKDKDAAKATGKDAAKAPAKDAPKNPAKDAAKDAAKDPVKDPAKAPAVVLRPATELAPAAK